jgi:hypothetical protein
MSWEEHSGRIRPDRARRRREPRDIQPSGAQPPDETRRLPAGRPHPRCDWPPADHIEAAAHAALPAPVDASDDQLNARPSHQRYQDPAVRPRTHHGRMTAPAILLIAGLIAIILGAISANGPIQITPANNPIQEGSPYPLSASGEPGSTAAPTTPPPSPSASASASPGQLEPPLTLAQAQQVVAGYWQTNSQANADLSESLLGEIETGSAYSLDAGIFKMDQAADPASRPRLAFDVSSPVYYIPREAANVYPHWFVVRFSYTPAAGSSTSPGVGYLVFTQTAPGATWQVALEPYLLHGSVPPFILADSQGYATAAAAGDATGPGQIPGQTAASLDGTSSAVTIPGTLSDLYDESAAAGRLPGGSQISDTHSAQGKVFGLETVGGGVLAFFGLTAQLQISAPAGQVFNLDKPGFYQPDQPLTSVSIGYVDEFAVYLPPGQDPVPQVVADASGTAG